MGSRFERPSRSFFVAIRHAAGAAAAIGLAAIAGGMTAGCVAASDPDVGVGEGVVSCEWTGHPEPPEASWCSGLYVQDDLTERRVAMTFDDGPYYETTPRIVAALREAEVPATFFVVGRMLEDERNREVLRDIHADPLFIVANHSYTHRDMVMLSDDELAQEMRDTNDAIRDALGDPCYHPPYFRFPYGGAECRETRVAEQLGMSVAGFDVDPVDWCFDEDGYCDPERVSWLPPEDVADLIDYLLLRLDAQDGGIVLLHDAMRYTSTVIAEILRRVREAGYTFVGLDELPELNASVAMPEPPSCCRADG